MIEKKNNIKINFFYNNNIYIYLLVKNIYFLFWN